MSELEGSDHRVVAMNHAAPSENVTSTTLGSRAGALAIDRDVAASCNNTNVVCRFPQKYNLIVGERYFVIRPDGSTYSGVLLSRNDPRLANIKQEFQQTPMDVEECQSQQQQPADHCMDLKALSEDDSTNLPSVPTATVQPTVPDSAVSTLTSTPGTASMTFPSSTVSLPLSPSPTPPESTVATTSSLPSKTNLRYHPYQRKRSSSWTSSDKLGQPTIGLTAVRKLSAQFTTECSPTTTFINVDPSVSRASRSSMTLSPKAPSHFSTTSSPLQVAATLMSPSQTDLESSESVAMSPLNNARRQSPTRSQTFATSPLLHSSSSRPSSISSPPSSPSFSLQHSILSSQPVPTAAPSFPRPSTLNRSLELSVTPSLTLPSMSQSFSSMSRSASPLSLPLYPKPSQNEVAFMHVDTPEMTPPETKVLETVGVDPSEPLLTSSPVLGQFPLSSNPLVGSLYMEADETTLSPVVSSANLNEPEKVDDNETNILEVMSLGQSEALSISTSSQFPSRQILPSTSLSEQSSPTLTAESTAAGTPEPMDVSETYPTGSSSPTQFHRSPSPPRTRTSLSPTSLVNTPQSEEVTVDGEKMDVSETGASEAEPLPLLSSISSHTTLTVPSSVSSKSLLVPAALDFSKLLQFSQTLQELALKVLNKSSSEPTTLPVSSLSGEPELTSESSGKEEVTMARKKTEDVVQILSSDDEDDSKSPGKKHKAFSSSDAANNRNNNNIATTETKNNNIIPRNGNNSTISNNNPSNPVATSNCHVTDDKTTFRIDLSTVLVAVHLRQTLFGLEKSGTFKQYLVFIDRLVLHSGGSESVTIPFTEVTAMYLHHGLSGPVFFLVLTEKFSMTLRQLLSICPMKFNPESSDLGSRYLILIPSKRNVLSTTPCDRNFVDSRMSLVKRYLETTFNHRVHLEMISGDRTSEILQAALINAKSEPEKQMTHTASCPDLRPDARATPPPSSSTPGIVLRTETLNAAPNQTPSNSGATALAITNGSSGNVELLTINGNGIGTGAGSVVTPKGSFILVTRNFRQLLQPVGGKGCTSPTVFRFARADPTAVQVPLRTPFNESIVTLFTYPPSPGPGRMPITNEDFYCLNDGEFLNDAIIDFYLKYILLEKIDAETCSRVHVFSSFFYGKLSDKVPEESPQSSGPTSQQIRHSRVKTWTRHVDIFSKDFLIVPINENAHWFLAIVCFPGLSGPILEQIPGGDKDDANGLDLQTSGSVGGTEKPKSFPKVRLRQPCILIFDSLGQANHFLVIKTLREYLQVEWDTRKLSTEGQREFNEQNVPGTTPRCPLQTNTSDCGVYLLQYVESFFLNPIVDFAMPIQNTANWFPQDLVRGKRKMLQNLIIQLKEKLNQSGASLAPTAAANSEQGT